MITDEMVEKAWKAQCREKDNYIVSMRAALEAVEPMIAAQTMLEAAGMVDEGKGYYTLLARAQELDPQ